MNHTHNELLPRGAKATLLALCAALAACATTVREQADALARQGRIEQAIETLDKGLAVQAGQSDLLRARQQLRDRLVLQSLAMAELARGQGRLDEAGRLLDKVQALDSAHPRLAAAAQELARAKRHEQAIVAAREALASQQPDRARRLVNEVLAEAPRQVLALQLLQSLNDRERERERRESVPTLSAAFQRPVSLEFRDAPLRQVFEALSRSSGVNFVFDREVRGDGRVTVFLRQLTLDEAMRVILSTQQLDRKLLNDNTVLIYPNTPTKQREHQELVTRTLFVANADVKQVLGLVRTMAKTRDLFADERLNVLVVRDTPEVVRLVEQLVATLDVAEPEVLLDVEVLEVATDQLDELGLSWPTRLQYGTLNNIGGLIPLRGTDFQALVANPAVVATLRGVGGNTRLLANPSIRARNREKAKVQIGEKLPVFTTTATANVGVSTSVAFLDVGLKLEVEPTVQLDGDVTIRVNLDVSNLVRDVIGPSGSLAYQVGTRTTATVLRLADGQTQVLAGLINDEDRKRATGVPGLAQMPLLGRLFGVQSDTRSKTEIVMLITPRIVRNLTRPDVSASTFASGTDSAPGAATLRLQRQARVGVAPLAGRAPPPVAAAATAGEASDAPGLPGVPGVPGAAEPPPPEPGLQLAVRENAAVGEIVSVSLANRSPYALSGQLGFDGQRLQWVGRSGAAAGAAVGLAAQGAAPVATRPTDSEAAAEGSRFTLAPGAEAVFSLRVLAAAAGQTLDFSVEGLQGSDAQGRSVAAETPPPASLKVRPAAGARP